MMPRLLVAVSGYRKLLKCKMRRRRGKFMTVLKCMGTGRIQRHDQTMLSPLETALAFRFQIRNPNLTAAARIKTAVTTKGIWYSESPRDADRSELWS